MSLIEKVRIRNLAIIEDIEFSLSKGLNVITGESGAGKSLIVKALGLLLGEKDDTSMIRQGKRELAIEVSVLLDGESHHIIETIKDLGLEEEDRISFGRVVSKDSRNRSHILGTLVSRKILTGCFREFADLLGQGECGRFKDPRFQHTLIDNFLEVEEDLAKYLKKRGEVFLLSKDHENLKHKLKDLEERYEASYALSLDMSNIDPKPGEESMLEEKRRLERHRKEIFDAIGMSKSVLYEEEHSAYESLVSAHKLLDSIGGLNTNFQAFADRIEQVIIEVEDISISLTRYLNDAIEPMGLEDIEVRLTDLRALKRRWNRSLEELIAMKDELKTLESSFELLQLDERQVNGSLGKKIKELCEIGEGLSLKRRNGKNILEGELAKVIKKLGIDHPLFEIVLEPVIRFENATLEERFPAYGLERLSLHISLNPGEGLKPIEKVASGGEMARILLSVYAVALDKSKLPVIIFDEIDAGVGGKGAMVLGQLLKDLSKNSQIVCITHNPVTASFADHHLVIVKKNVDNRSYTHVAVAKGEERTLELERMLVGSNKAKHASLLASELLNDDERNSYN